MHTTENVFSWFKRNSIEVFPHPPYSPDLNPIENVWSLLKNHLSKRSRSFLGLGNNQKSIAAFTRAIFEEWQAIPQQDIDNCILSLPRRWQAAVEAKGWYTKY